MLESYLKQGHFLQFPIWWINKVKNTVLDVNGTLFFYKNKYIVSLNSFFTLLLNVFILFYKTLKFKGQILFLILKNLPLSFKAEKVLIRKNIFVISYWFRGLLTNFKETKWWIFSEFGVFWKYFKQPQLLINLGFKGLADKDAQKKGLASISFLPKADYQLIASDFSLDVSYFYLSFFLRLSTNWFKKKTNEQ